MREMKQRGNVWRLIYEALVARAAGRPGSTKLANDLLGDVVAERQDILKPPRDPRSPKPGEAK